MALRNSLRPICSLKHRSSTATTTATNARWFHLNYVDLNGISIRGLSPEDSNKNVIFHNAFLRDATSEQTAVDEDSGQKKFSTGQLDKDVHAQKAAVVNDTLKITWSDGHQAQYTKQFLQRYITKNTRRHYRGIDKSSSWVSWGNFGSTSSIQKNLLYMNYEDYMNNTDVLANAVNKLEAMGLVIVTDMPRQSTDPGSEVIVEKVASRLGVIRDTFYGRSWDVKSIPQAKNVAYTSEYLPLHMDLCYYESPPGIQLLHVIENKALGGESLFADSYAAAFHVLQHDLDAYKALRDIPFTFHYVNDGFHYYYQRPLIVEDPYSPLHPKYGVREIQHINYSTPFQGPLDEIATFDDISVEQLAAFRRGLSLFEKYIAEKQNMLEMKMDEGTCVIFMNRRILHGRRYFNANSGNRWFKGTYLDIDSFNSQWRVHQR